MASGVPGERDWRTYESERDQLDDRAVPAGDGVHVTLEDVRREPLVTGLLRAGEARAMAADLAAAADATDAIAGEWARP
jgi:hypothetical protein